MNPLSTMNWPLLYLISGRVLCVLLSVFCVVKLTLYIHWYGAGALPLVGSTAISLILLLTAFTVEGMRLLLVVSITTLMALSF